MPGGQVRIRSAARVCGIRRVLYRRAVMQARLQGERHGTVHACVRLA